MFANQLRAKQFGMSDAATGKKNLLFEKVAYIMKKKFDFAIFSKEMKNEGKIAERRRMGFTRVEY